MSLNLGTSAVEAAKELRSNAAFQQVRDGLREQVRARTNMALECAPEQRVDATGYARALRDVWVAIESAANGVPQNKVEKTGPGKV